MLHKVSNNRAVNSPASSYQQWSVCLHFLPHDTRVEWFKVLKSISTLILDEFRCSLIILCRRPFNKVLRKQRLKIYLVTVTDREVVIDKPRGFAWLSRIYGKKVLTSYCRWVEKKIAARCSFVQWESIRPWHVKNFYNRSEWNEDEIFSVLTPNILTGSFVIAFRGVCGAFFSVSRTSTLLRILSAFIRPEMLQFKECIMTASPQQSYRRQGNYSV